MLIKATWFDLHHRPAFLLICIFAKCVCCDCWSICFIVNIEVTGSTAFFEDPCILIRIALQVLNFWGIVWLLFASKRSDRACSVVCPYRKTCLERPVDNEWVIFLWKLNSTSLLSNAKVLKTKTVPPNTENAHHSDWKFRRPSSLFSTHRHAGFFATDLFNF